MARVEANGKRIMGQDELLLRGMVEARAGAELTRVTKAERNLWRWAESV